MCFGFRSQDLSCCTRQTEHNELQRSLQLLKCPRNFGNKRQSVSNSFILGFLNAARKQILKCIDVSENDTVFLFHFFPFSLWICSINLSCLCNMFQSCLFVLVTTLLWQYSCSYSIVSLLHEECCKNLLSFSSLQLLEKNRLARDVAKAAVLQRKSKSALQFSTRDTC